VEAPAIEAFGLDHQVHVRVLLMGVERHGVAVLRTELLARKDFGGGQHLIGRRRRRHGKHDVVRQLDTAERLDTAGRCLRAAWRRTVLAGRELQVPVAEQFFVAATRHA
jgi:hypothetical protein